MLNDINPIVIDSGSSLIKAGFSGYEAPEHVFPSIIGRPTNFVSGNQDLYIGDETFKYDGFLTITSPFDNGFITNWDDIENIWQYIFSKKLRVDPSQHPIIYIDPQIAQGLNLNMNKKKRKKIAQIMFETFNIPSFLISSSSVASLYGAARTTGIVLECGHSVTNVTPFYMSNCTKNAIMSMNFAGNQLTSFLNTILNNLEHDFVSTTSDPKDIIRNIKEKYCYVALDFNAELKKAKSSSICDASHTLPNGKVLKLSDERFRCPELLFTPKLNYLKSEGIHQMLFHSINKCDKDIQKYLYESIILSGGTTTIQGFPERFEKEIIQLAPSTVNPKVVALPERKYLAWIGGSILGVLEKFTEMVVTRREFNEEGPKVVSRKFF